jgi:hypothetical protein
MMTSSRLAHLSRRVLGLIFLTMLTSTGLWANDDFFPSSPDAAKVIDFDGRGFIINGKRTFITSGSIHFARVPKENWHDVLLKLKRSATTSVASLPPRRDGARRSMRFIRHRSSFS